MHIATITHPFTSFAVGSKWNICDKPKSKKGLKNMRAISIAYFMMVLLSILPNVKVPK